jgi:hypothetical protein
VNYAGVRLSLVLGHHVAQENQEHDERHNKDRDHNQRTNNPFLGPPTEIPLGSAASRSLYRAFLSFDRGIRGKEPATAAAAAKRFPTEELTEDVGHARAPRPTNFAAATNGTRNHEGLA